MSNKWPTNEEVSNFIFEIDEVDSIKDFDFVARAALIMREISVKDYVRIESVRKNIKDGSFSLLSFEARQILKQSLLSI